MTNSIANSLIELATRLVVVRIYRKWEKTTIPKHVLTIELLTIAMEPPKLINIKSGSLIHVRYEATIPSSGYFFSDEPARRLIKFTYEPAVWERWVKDIMDSWRAIASQLWTNSAAVTCDIDSDGHVMGTIPLSRLDLLLHYVRLKTLIEVGDDLDLEEQSVLLKRFDSFIQTRTYEWENAANIIKIP